jgi:hypothetical protein
MSYSVKIVCSRRIMKDFLDLPDLVYKGDPNYVAPLKAEVRRTLDGKKNPYFKGAELRLFVCYADDSPVARTAIVINPRHEQKFGVRAAFFGFFESMNDPGAARALFESAARFCRGQGATILEGPFNPNHYSELGLLLDNFDRPPVFFQTYNPPYYPKLLKELGFHVSASLFTARNERIAEYIDAHFDPLAPLSIPEGYAVRHPDMSRLPEEMEKIRLIFNDSFSSNWHFLPASREEYDFSAKFLNLITDPSLISIIDHHGEPVAVVMCVLDVNPLIQRFHGRRGPLKLLNFLRGRRRIRTVVLYAGGIRKRYQHTRVYPLLYEACARIVRRFDCLEGTWISDGNMLARRSAERLGMKPDKHFAIYALSIDSDTNSGPISDNPMTYQEGESRILSAGNTIEVEHG